MTRGVSIFEDLVEQLQRTLGVGEGDEGRGEETVLVVEAPLGAEVPVQRDQIGVEPVVVVLELHLDARQRRVVHDALDALGVHHRQPVGGIVELLLQFAVPPHELLAALLVERPQRVEPVQQRAGNEVCRATRAHVARRLVALAAAARGDAQLVERVTRERDLEVRRPCRSAADGR